MKSKKNVLLRKLTAISLAAVMFGGSAAAALPVFGSTDSGIVANAAVYYYYYGNFQYIENSDGGITITNYDGSASELVIPSVIDGKSVTTIDYNTFENNTTLTSVTIPESVEEIDGYIFSGLKSLKSIFVDDNNPSYSSVDGVLFNKDKTTLICYPSSKTGEYKIPENVTTISECAFLDCNNLTEITIPDNVAWLGMGSFSRCTNLTTVTLPDNSELGMGGGVFSDCTNLKNVNLGKGISYLYIGMFSRCTNLESIVIPDNVKTIDNVVFDGCTKLKNVTISNGVEYISSRAFIDCPNLKSVNIPNSVTDIEENAFGYYTVNDVYEDIERYSDFTIYGATGSEAERYANDNGFTFVDPSIVPVTSISLNKTKDTLNKGATLTLNATVLPANATDKTIKWTSSKTSVATVSNGTVKAVGVGTATITATTSNGKQVKCTVTVKSPATKITLNKTSATLEKGKSITLKATVSPSDTTDKVTWTSSNTSVATVSNGKVTAKKAGTVTITAKTTNGKTATCKVTVKNVPEKVTLNKTSATLLTGKSVTLKAMVTPTNAVNKTVTWTSSNKNIATVSKGKVTAKKAGTVTITAKTSNGKKATCKITVKSQPTSVKLNKTKATVGKGETVTLKATVSPSNAVNKTVTWTTSNKKIATVKNGKVTTKKTGTVTITAKTSNGKKATCKITVKKAPSKIKLNKTKVTITKGKTVKLTSSVNSGAASLKRSYSSSNKSVCTVDSTGKVTAKKAGTATITVKTYNGKKATCKVTVKNPAAPKHSKAQQTTSKWKASDHEKDKVYSSGGYVMYEMPEILPYVNYYRRQAGVPELKWARSDSARKETLDLWNSFSASKLGKLRKATPEFFNSDGSFNVDAFIEDSLMSTRNSLEYCIKTQSLNHVNIGGYSSLINGTMGSYDPQGKVESIKNNSPGHWEGLMDPELTTLYVVYEGSEETGFTITFG